MIANQDRMRWARSVLASALITLSLASTGCSRNESAVELLQDAKQRYEKGDINAAIIQLKNLLENDPKNSEARFLLGRASNNVRVPILTEKELRKALELGFDRTAVAPELARSLLAQGQFQKVLDQVMSGINVKTAETSEFRTIEGDAQLGLGHIKNAQSAYDQALKNQ